MFRQAGKPAAAFLDPLKQLPNRIHPHCAYNHIEVIEPVEQFLAELLGHAAPRYNLEVRFYILEPAQASDKRVDLLFRLLAHRAGVEKNDVGFADVIDRHIPSGASSRWTRSESYSFIWQPNVRTYKPRGLSEWMGVFDIKTCCPAQTERM